MARVALWVGIALALVALPLVYRTGMHGAALFDGDEAIYAEMALEMRATHDVVDLRFDGAPLYPRPPMAVWSLALADSLADPEPALFGSLAIVSALCVALTMVLGARLFSVGVGLLAGALLGVSDLWAGYARTYESEPVLVAFVLGAFCFWAAPTRTRATWLGFGVCLGGALLTKQLVGFVPLGALLVDAFCRRSLRGAWVGLLSALAVALPWHIVEIARHGHAFVDSFFVQSLLGRASTALIKRTSATFYLRTIVESEGWIFGVAMLGSALVATPLGLRRREPGALLVGGWALGVLAIYSLSRSRYDYYALLAYPALLLALAYLVWKLPRGLALGASIASIVLAAALHLPRNVLPLTGDADTRALLAGTDAIAPGAPLYTLDRYPYTARVYSQRHVFVLVEQQRDFDAAQRLRATGMPAPAVLASPASDTPKLVARPSLVILPTARADILQGSDARMLGESGALRLYLVP